MNTTTTILDDAQEAQPINVQTMKLLHGAITVDIAEESGWFQNVTVNEAVDLIQQGGYEVIKRVHIVRDPYNAGYWMQTGDYSVELKQTS